MQFHTAPTETAAAILNQIASASAHLQRALAQARGDLDEYGNSPGRVNVYTPRLSQVIALGARVDALIDAIAPLQVEDDLIFTARRATALRSERPYFQPAR